MAKYTVELKTLLENEQVKPLIDKALSTYPVYTAKSENLDIVELFPTREQLNKKLLDHYKYREIGFETVGRFLDELEIAMNEIMPYYNEMYQTVEIMQNVPNPFDNVDIVETFKEQRTGSSSSSDTTRTVSSAEDESSTSSGIDSNSKRVESTTPQGEISTPASEIDSVNYADKVAWDKSKSTNTGTSSGSSSTEATSENNGNSETTGIVEHTFTKKGNYGVQTYAHDINEFRTSVIDVTIKILEDRRIKDLFMQVF